MIAHAPKSKRRLTEPFLPMEAQLVHEIPTGRQWQYEPKWDGFRALVFRRGARISLQSKAGQSLTRYFPEVVEALRELPADHFVLDGELVVPVNGHLSFDDLLMRIHPAASRVEKLARETPAQFIAFDLLQDGDGEPLVDLPLRERRKTLESFAREQFPKRGSIRLSLATKSLTRARQWLSAGDGGLDGVIAKDLEMSYRSGERIGMQKIKRKRTAECVVGGFRYASKHPIVGSLLLGLYDRKGILNHVGYTSSLSEQVRRELTPKLEKLRKPVAKGGGFTGRAPGGPSRWSTKRSGEWESLEPKLVVEVQWDHFTGGRFRHGTKFLRWRPDKPPRTCSADQLK